jgi:hypothetical protein
LLLVFSSLSSDEMLGFGAKDAIPIVVLSSLGGLGSGEFGGGGTLVGKTSSGFGGSTVEGMGLVMVNDIFDVGVRGAGLAVILGTGNEVIFGGL